VERPDVDGTPDPVEEPAAAAETPG
jgi:hypothetical protein